MALSYEFSIGSVRVKENTLFTSSDIEHMLSCKSDDELCRYLSDKGYGEGSTTEEIIKSHTKAMWAYLKSVAPDFKIFSPFLYQNDIHNLKAILKGTMAGRAYRQLFLFPCAVDTDVMTEAVENRKFSLLPEWLSQPSDKAYEVLTHTGDARLSDAILDRALMEEMLSCAEELHSDFLIDYFKNTVFYGNIKVAIRSARTGADKAFLEQALCALDGFNKSAVTASAVKGIDSLLDTLGKCSDYDCNRAIEAYKASPSAFEKFVDDRLIVKAKEACKRASEGAEPLMGYLIGNEAEVKVIHIIDCGIRTDSSQETIRERLREISG
ncbi:MAG: V-type ATPase subunit [Clostridiales bacterium]|nr:V-type ATPase subunit [Clostridiales bacterium]